jgi:hypothetical protein
MGALVFLLLWALLGAIALASFVHNLGRRRALARFAFEYGFQFAPTDLFGLIDHGFDLFNRGDRARCQNVVWGEWQGIQVKSGELWFDSRSHDSWPLAGTNRSDASFLYRRDDPFSFALVEVPAFLPHVSIRRRKGIVDLGAILDPNDLKFESDRFNRTFEVRSGDREFAYKLVDAGMMLWLLGIAARFPFEFEVNGPRLLVYGGRVKLLLPLIATAKQYADHVPRSVLLQYPLSAPAG